MPETTAITLDGQRILAPRGAVVSVALLIAGVPCRKSVDGQPRTAVCGMGICFECCAVVNGIAHTRTCQLVCEPGMIVETEP